MFSRFILSGKLIDSVFSTLHSDETLLSIEYKEISYLHKTVFGEFDSVFTDLEVQMVLLDEQFPRFQFDSFLGVQYQGDLFLFDHIKDEQGGVLIGKIRFFEVIPMPLCEMEAPAILFDTRMKVIDDPLVLKFLAWVVPETVPV